MTHPVMVVATPGWMPATDAREELKAFRFEVIPSDSIYRLRSHDFHGGSAAVFVDKPSLGGDTVKRREQAPGAAICSDDRRT